MNVSVESGSIPTRTRQQALDWSLVLASQGIESTILAPDEERGFRLEVARPEYGRAVRILRQYHVENRARLWRHEMPWAQFIFDIRAVGWVAIWVVIFVLESQGWDHLRAAGLMDTEAAGRGEWWRLFTAVTLHGDASHLVANVTSGLVLLGLALGSFGWGWGVLAAYLAGAGGNLAGWILYTEPHRSLGASGMVMGALGMLAVDSLTQARRTGETKSLALRGLFGGIMLLVLLGFNPESDVVAHVGGFVCGGLLGMALSFLPREWLADRWWNHAMQILCAAGMIFTWWLALR